MTVKWQFSGGSDWNQLFQVRTIVVSITDLLPRWRLVYSASTCVIVSLFFLCAVPLTSEAGLGHLGVLTVHANEPFIITFIALCLLLALNCVYGTNRFIYDLEYIMGLRKSTWYRKVQRVGVVIVWMFVLPVTMVTVLVSSMYVDDVHNTHEGVLANLIFYAPLVLIFGTAVGLLARREGSVKERLAGLLKPGEDWGPSSDGETETYSNTLKLSDLLASLKAYLTCNEYSTS